MPVCMTGAIQTIFLSCLCLSIFVLVFYVVLVFSYRLCCLPFPSCSVLKCLVGWQILIWFKVNKYHDDPQELR